jgi:hypothetical protein
MAIAPAYLLLPPLQRWEVLEPQAATPTVTRARPSVIVREYLVTSGTALYDAVGINVYWPRLPAGYDGASTKGIVLRQLGGSVMPAIGKVINAQLEVRCFGGARGPAGAEAARDVYEALQDRLHDAQNESVDSGYIIGARESTAGADLIDPDTEWPHVYVTYNVQVRVL